MVKTKLRAENDIRADKQKGIAVFSDRSLCAGMTVEAALVLPLFLFFIFNVVFLLDAVNMRGTGSMRLAGRAAGHREAVREESRKKRGKSSLRCMLQEQYEANLAVIT